VVLRVTIYGRMTDYGQLRTSSRWSQLGRLAGDRIRILRHATEYRNHSVHVMGTGAKRRISCFGRLELIEHSRIGLRGSEAAGWENDMSQNRIAQTWRDHVVNKLQDRYGLTQEQARTRADLWLQWIREQPRLQLAELGRSRGPRQSVAYGSHGRSSKSRSAATCP
jgi:hypothetical protein